MVVPFSGVSVALEAENKLGSFISRFSSKASVISVPEQTDKTKEIFGSQLFKVAIPQNFSVVPTQGRWY